MRLAPVLALTLPALAAAAPDPALDAAFRTYWDAASPNRTAAAVAEILTLDPELDAVLERLRRGRPYSPEVPTGRHVRSRWGGGFHYTLLVPADYDPARPYPVRVYLHGGVNRPPPRPDGRWWRRDDALAHPGTITVLPVAWRDAMWWEASQVENLAASLNELKRTYNLDENRVYLLGISDGATGVYFHAFRAPTPWAAFLPFIGHPAVLGNRDLRVDGQMYVRNLTNRPFFVVNAQLDHLYPTGEVLPYLQLFHRAGTEIEFRNQPESTHGTSWWPQEAERIDAFIAAHRRDPLPDRIVWETERTDRYHRCHWLLITELGPVAGESDLDDPNIVTPPPLAPALGLTPDPASKAGVVVMRVSSDSVARAAGIRRGDLIVELGGVPTRTLEELTAAMLDHARFEARVAVVVERRGKRLEKTLRFPPEPEPLPPSPAFPRRKPSGQVEVERRGNDFVVRTRGVRRYRLLVSPDEVDLSRPVTVTTNGVESFRGRLEPDLATLLRWASRDHDRTMLFAAELEIEVR